MDLSTLVEDRVAVGVGGHWDAEPRHCFAHDCEVAVGVLLFSKASPGDLAGRVVDGADQAQVRSSPLELVMATGVHLQQHAFLGGSGHGGDGVWEPVDGVER